MSYLRKLQFVATGGIHCRLPAQFNESNIEKFQDYPDEYLELIPFTYDEKVWPLSGRAVMMAAELYKDLTDIKIVKEETILNLRPIDVQFLSKLLKKYDALQCIKFHRAVLKFVRAQAIDLFLQPLVAVFGFDGNRGKNCAYTRYFLLKTLEYQERLSVNLLLIAQRLPSPKCFPVGTL